MNNKIYLFILMILVGAFQLNGQCPAGDPDTDQDGICNALDQDDDNDGIKDIDETICSNVSLDNLTFNGIALSLVEPTKLNLTTNPGWRSSYSAESFSLPISLKFRADISALKMFGLIPVGANQTLNSWNDGSYKAYLHTNGRLYGKFPDAWTFWTGNVHNKIIEINIDTNGNLSIYLESNLIHSGAAPIGDYNLVVTSYTGGSIEEISLLQNNQPCTLYDVDTDTDGVVDRLDLDSDADDCVDAYEGGEDFVIADMDNIGRLLGTVNTDPNSPNYGVPTIAGSGQSSNESQSAYGIIPDIRECLCIASNNPVDSDNDGICDIADICNTISDALIGTPCNDGDDCTANDVWTINCDCAGTYQDSDGDSICDFEDNCPNYDNSIDIDNDDIPDCQDNCIDVDENGICDQQEPGFTIDKLKLYTSHRRGFYEQPISLNLLTNNPNASIYYTTDGTIPTTSSQLYNGNSIPISTTTILRTIAYSAQDTTRTATHSFIFHEDIIEDPTLKSYIVEHPIWGDKLLAAFKSIPSISLVSDSTLNADTSVSGSMEMLFPNSIDNFQANCGLGNYGNASLNLAKRNIRMYFDSIYGPKNLKFPVFEGFENGVIPIEKFDKLDLRSSHESWLWDGTDWHQGETYLATKLMDDIMLRGGSVNPHNRFVHVYVDGKYWGQYDLREKFDDNMLAEYLGGENEDYDFISGSKVTVSAFYPADGVLKDGTGNEWNTLVNSSDNYQLWKTMVDENSFFDLMILFMYGFAEAEWNAAGAPSLGKEFHFQVNDADLFFSRGLTDRTNRTYPQHNANGPNNMFLRLFNEADPDFIQDFTDRTALMLNYDGLLTPAVLKAHIDEIMGMIDLSIIGEAAKWSGEYTEHPDQWQERLAFFKDSMVTDRIPYLISQLKTSGLYPNLDPAVFALQEGLVPVNSSLAIINPNNIGTMYYTLDGSDPRAAGGSINTSAIQYTTPINIPGGVTQVNARIKGQETTYPETNIAVNKPISASRILQNRPLEQANNDTIWGITSENQVALVSYNSGENPWLEIDLETIQDIDLVRIWNASEAAIGLRFDSPYIFISNQPFISPLATVLLADPNVQSFQFNGVGADVFEIPVNAQGRYVRLLVDKLTSFNCSEFEIIQVDSLNPIVKDIWSPMVPQTYYTEIDYSGIVINEIHYNQDTSRCNTDSLDVEFLEITNVGTQPVNLSGCYLSDGVRFQFPYQTIISPGDFIVLAEDTTDYNLAFGKQADGQFGGALDNGGEYIRLSDPFGYTIDSLIYNDRNPWDENPDGYGPSLELLNPMFDNADPLNWFRSDNSCGTPGAANSRVCNNTASSIVINEINYNSNNTVNDPGDWVELHNPNATAADISGWTFYDNNNEFIFPAGTTLDPNEFLVLIENDALFTSVFSNVPANRKLGDFDFGLSNKGERVSLFDENKCLSDYVIYNDRSPWDSLPDGNGPTLSLIDPALDNSLPESWEASTNITAPLGTPGRANTPCPTFTITAPAIICKGDSVLLETTANSNVNFNWSIQGGSPSVATGNAVYVTFPNPGLAIVELQYTYFECSGTDQILLTVETCNTAPIPQSDNYTINEDSILTSNVLTNDQDAENQPLSATLVVDVLNGNLTLNPDGSFTYSPNLNYFGSDNFIYEVCDNATPALCATQLVNIIINSVNDSPVTVPDLYTTTEDNPISGNVLTNDSDIEGDILSATVTSQPTNGTITLQANGDFVYTPDPNYFGSDAFVYQVCDDGIPSVCLTENVTLSISPVNDSPVAVNDIFSTNEDNSLNNNVLTNDTEIENQPMVASLVASPANGTVTLNPNGDFQYIPTPNYFGIDSFSYNVCDDSSPALCTTQSVIINILSVNDIPIIRNDTLATDEGVQVAGNASTNDFDVETPTMTYTLVSFTQNGSVLFNFDGSFYYTPFAGFSGTETFQYKACDNGTPNYCDTATVYIEVIKDCFTLDIALFLESPFDTQTGLMSTTLNTVRAVLPGMTNNPTSGQPYDNTPWNYLGTEGLGWTDTDYSPTVVDWVLISLRTGLTKSTEVAQVAGLLHTDGTVSFPGECLATALFPDDYYIVAEHRNHMAVMSPVKLSVVNRVLSWDFRLADSYAVGGAGAKELVAGVWGLYAGDANQIDDVVSYDINGQDKSAWLIDNGKFGVYLSTDINMNGDVNGSDKALWLLNNGIFSSVKK